MHLKKEVGIVAGKKRDDNIEAVMEQLFKREYNKLCAFAGQLTDDQEQGRDIVADAFEYAWNHAGDHSESELRSLIYTVVHDRSIDFMRKKKVEQRYLDFYNRMLRIEDGETIDQKLATIETALKTMTPKAQQMLRSCYHLHRTYDEVAEDMRMSKSTLKVRLSEALKDLCNKVKLLNG